MKQALSSGIFFLLAVTYLFRGFNCDEVTETRAVTDLIRRIVPALSDRFRVDVNYSFVAADGKEIFQLNSSPRDDARVSTVTIKGSSGPAAAYGLHFYLKYYLNLHVSWSGDQLTPLSSDLAAVDDETIILQDKFRYYFNVCTFR